MTMDRKPKRTNTRAHFPTRGGGREQIVPEPPRVAPRLKAEVKNRGIKKRQKPKKGS